MTRNELLGKNLKKLRENAGITSQRQLSDLCGWASQSRVGNYEAGTRSIGLDEAYILAETLTDFGFETKPQDILFINDQTNETEHLNINSHQNMISSYAKRIKSDVTWLEKKLDEANCLLERIYASGADLNELEKPVHDYLTKR